MLKERKGPPNETAKRKEPRHALGARGVLRAGKCAAESENETETGSGRAKEQSSRSEKPKEPRSRTCFFGHWGFLELETVGWVLLEYGVGPCFFCLFKQR